MSSIPIGLTPFHEGGQLNGILISGRWPASTLEWTQTLVASVRIACRPGFLSTTTIFGVVEDHPADAEPDAVGMMLAVGNVVDDTFLEAGRFLHNPPALLMLHPPSHTRPSLPECSEVASGCVLLPGLDAEVLLPEGVGLQPCEEGFCFFSVFSPSALAYAPAVR